MFHRIVDVGTIHAALRQRRAYLRNTAHVVQHIFTAWLYGRLTNRCDFVGLSSVILGPWQEPAPEIGAINSTPDFDACFFRAEARHSDVIDCLRVRVLTTNQSPQLNPFSTLSQHSFFSCGHSRSSIDSVLFENH